jgi:hypothetical protein
MTEYISKEAVKDIINSGVCIDTDSDRKYVCELIDNLPVMNQSQNEEVTP